MTNPSTSNDLKDFINSDEGAHRQFVKDDVERATAGEISHHLKSVDIFSHLHDHQLLDIADVCTLKVFNPGDCIVKAGEQINNIFIILIGDAGVYRTSSFTGKVVQVSTVTKSDIIGAIDCFHNRNYGATVTAHVPISCAMMDNTSFNTLVKPILEDLRIKGERYQKFLNAFV